MFGSEYSQLLGLAVALAKPTSRRDDDACREADDDRSDKADDAGDDNDDCRDDEEMVVE